MWLSKPDQGSSSAASGVSPGSAAAGRSAVCCIVMPTEMQTGFFWLWFSGWSMNSIVRISLHGWTVCLRLRFVTPILPTVTSIHFVMRRCLWPLWAISTHTFLTCALRIGLRTIRTRGCVPCCPRVVESPQNSLATLRKYAWKAWKCTRTCSVLGATPLDFAIACADALWTASFAPASGVSVAERCCCCASMRQSIISCIESLICRS
mmetsp:Transcript_52618/g.101606  ORF Transcript_52618/g.101606 Transcript_52618/m.101606 type:complete len:207 (-) Transcript_52618:65-685(-)